MQIDESANFELFQTEKYNLSIFHCSFKFGKSNHHSCIEKQNNVFFFFFKEW